MKTQQRSLGVMSQLAGSTLPRDLHMLINLRDNVSMPKKQEITANDLIEVKRAELARLCAAYHVHRLELFGSATGEEFEPDTSDLDFLVEFKDLSPGEHADAFFGLIEALQSTFGRPVDLLERRAIRNPYFLRAIEQTRMVVYAAA
jgi:uncharacterized protein